MAPPRVCARAAMDTTRDNGLPPGWASVTTSNGGVYYYHEATRKSTWEPPLRTNPPPPPPPAPPRPRTRRTIDEMLAEGGVATAAVAEREKKKQKQMIGGGFASFRSVADGARAHMQMMKRSISRSKLMERRNAMFKALNGCVATPKSLAEIPSPPPRMHCVHNVGEFEPPRARARSVDRPPTRAPLG